MTIFHLVRHGNTELPDGLLGGRTFDFGLSAAGRTQILGLRLLLWPEKIERIYASPLKRTQESAHLLARDLGVPVQTVDDLNELNFGAWSGQAFENLDRQQDWNEFNSFRSGSRIPNGELMLEAQTRVVALMLRLRDEFPDGRLLVVSHGDMIRAALLYFLGMPLDFVHRLRVDTSSVSSLRIDRNGAELTGFNRLPAI